MVPVRIRPVPPPRLRRHDERPRFMDLGIGYPSPCKRHVHPEVARMGFVRNRDQYASVRGGFLSLFPAAYGVHSPADAPALTSQGSDFLSPFPRPAKAGHMVGVAQQEERRSAKPCQPRVRIPPRPPGAHMPHRCQKWESPNLSSADSRQRPPAGVILPGGYMGQ